METWAKRIYRLLAVDSGKPNRKLMRYYRKVMQEMGYDAKMFITDIGSKHQTVDYPTQS